MVLLWHNYNSRKLRTDRIVQSVLNLADVAVHAEVLLKFDFLHLDMEAQFFNTLKFAHKHS